MFAKKKTLRQKIHQQEKWSAKKKSPTDSKFTCPG